MRKPQPQQPPSAGQMPTTEEIAVQLNQLLKAYESDPKLMIDEDEED